MVNVAEVAGAVIATLLILVAVATPITGAVNVLFDRVWVPVRVATVESIAIVTPVDQL
jgi:hypothetical protein